MINCSSQGRVWVNTVNYLSLSCQMFSTIISYNKSFNSAANQIKWSTSRKCCHCIFSRSTNCRQGVISHIHFPWATNVSPVSGEVMNISNIDEGDVLGRYIFPRSIVHHFSKKSYSSSLWLCNKIDILVIFWWEGSVRGTGRKEIRSISISRVSVSVVFIHGWAPPSGLICSFSFIAAAQPQYWFSSLL